MKPIELTRQARPATTTVDAINEHKNLRIAEVWVKTSPEVCAERDPKGLYKKAAAGELPNLTGVGQDYETPESAELVLDGARPVDESVELLIEKFFC
jgi:adenylylsulfate kinase-like enzyme